MNIDGILTPDDCAACQAMPGELVCAYHQGFLDGMEYCAKIANLGRTDPEQLKHIIGQWNAAVADEG